LIGPLFDEPTQYSMAAAASSSSGGAGGGALRDRFIALLRENADGLNDKAAVRELGTENAQLMPIINALLEDRQIEIHLDTSVPGKQTLIYKMSSLNPHDIEKYADLEPNHMLVLQHIEKAGNTGIWTRDIKNRTNLQNNSLTKILKLLEGKCLVKAVTSYTGKNKKLYMMFNLTPSRELTGGPWYTDGEFDYEFIYGERGVSKFIQGTIENEGTMSISDLTAAVSESGLYQVHLEQAEIQSIVTTLVYDGLVEAVITSRGGGMEQKVYKPARVARSMNYWTDTPCGLCPVFEQCSPGGIIAPEKCKYMKEWLQQPTVEDAMATEAAEDGSGAAVELQYADA
jgi:DNA-directed RNA polymerase III subunit RPC6